MTAARTTHAHGGLSSPLRPDWRSISVAIVMTAAFVGAIALPETIPYALIWAAVIASAAFVTPAMAGVLGIYGLALSIVGGYVSGNANSQIFWAESWPTRSSVRSPCC